METIDSVFWAAVIGAVVLVAYNEFTKQIPNNTDAVMAGAVVGATVQLVVRATGIS